jgi:hypothetical protein
MRASSVADSFSSADDGWVSEHSAEPEAVRLFCKTHDLLSDVARAVTLTKSHFTGAKPSLWIEQDTDSDAELLILDTPARMTVDQALAAHEARLDEWIASAPPGTLGKIHLTFTIIEP